MSEVVPSFEEAEAVICRHFVVDAGTDLRSLYQQFDSWWQDRSRVLGQIDTMFYSRNAELVHGFQWWEQRQQGKRDPVTPITPMDQLCMLLCTDPLIEGRPRPRPFCPERIRGSWRVISADLRDGRSVGDDSGGTMRLGADGALELRGQLPYDASAWRAHTLPDGSLQLWLARGRARHELDVELEGAVLLLRDHRSPIRLTRWTRVQ